MKIVMKNKKWILLGIVIILIIAISAIGVLTNSIPVEISSVEKGEVVKLIKEAGTVESKSTVMLTAKNGGEINNITVSEGEEVKAGTSLITSDRASAQLDMKSLQAELSGIRAQYSQASDLANKNKILYEQGALSYEEYNQTATVAKQLEAQIEALNYSIKSYEESAGTSGIIAPIDGVITGVFVKEGEAVMPGSQLLEISNLDDRYLKVDLIAEDADLVKIGDQVHISNDNKVLSDSSCTVKKVHLKAQEKVSDLGIVQKRVTVEIAMDNNVSLRLGSDVDAEIVVNKKDDVLRISQLAIFEKEQKDYVFVIKDGKALLREITTGLEGEDFTEVQSGLSEGEEVIVSPSDDIEDGVRVKSI